VVDAEGVDLVQRVVARRGVEQLARSLEGHALLLAAPAVAGQREQHERPMMRDSLGSMERPL
jgi:hypothetical protein